MEKLFRFSKIASIVVLLIAIFRIISSGIVLMFEPIFEYYRTIEIVNDILFILFNTLILIFFLLIYKNSTNGSVLRIPTLIGMISSAVAMICRLFLTFTYYGGFLDILNYRSMYKFYLDCKIHEKSSQNIQLVMCDNTCYSILI